MANWWDDLPDAKPTGGGGGSRGSDWRSSLPDAPGSTGGPSQDALLAQARKNAGPGASDAEIRELAARMGPKPPDANAPPARSGGEQFVRGAAMPFQGANERIAEYAGFIPDQTARFTNAIGLTDPSQNIPVTENLKTLLAGAPGSAARMTPENTTERALHGAGAGAVDATAMMGGGAALEAAAPVVGPVAAGVGKVMQQGPALQLGSGMVGGGTSEATGNPWLGLLAGMTTPAGLAMARKMVGPGLSGMSAEAQRLYDVAKQRYGIDFLPGQATGNKVLQLVEGSMAELPGTAGPQREILDKQGRAFTRGSLSHSDTVSDSAAPSVIGPRRKDIGQEIGDITQRYPLDMNTSIPVAGGAPNISHPLAAELNNIERNNAGIAHEGIGDTVISQINALRGRVDPATGQIPGPAFREWNTEVQRLADGAQNSDLARRLNQLRETALGAHAQNMTPEDAAALATARRNYANIAVTRDAMASPGRAANVEGQVPPKQLQGALERSVGPEGYAEGMGDQNDLARIGQGFFSEPPNSMTSARGLMISLLRGAPLLATGAGLGAGAGGMLGLGPYGAAAGALVLPRALQAAYNLPAVRQAIMNGGPDVRGAVGTLMAQRLLEQQRQQQQP